MEENKEITVSRTEIQAAPDSSPQIRQQQFTALLNKKPNQDELSKTPDGKAEVLPISFVEMTLDELFFGEWSTENFSWQTVGNEVNASIDLVVTSPVTGRTIRRVGAASIKIKMDKAPDNLSQKEKNAYAMDLVNKKPNAFYLDFPKLKAECVLNAARSLGKVFGRDINRTLTDTYKPLIKINKEEAIDLSTEDKIKRAFAAGKITASEATEAALKLKDGNE